MPSMDRFLDRWSAVPFLRARWKLLLHIVMLNLVILAIALTGARLSMAIGPVSRSNTVAIGMGAKSIVFIAYQLLTEHTPKFAKWASLKASAVINALEVVFWMTVVGLLMQGNARSCQSTGCALSWLVVLVSFILAVLSAQLFMLYFIEFHLVKRGQQHKIDSNNRSP